MAVSVLTSFKNDRKNSKCTAGGKIDVFMADTRLKHQECRFFEVSEAPQARGLREKNVFFCINDVEIPHFCTLRRAICMKSQDLAI